MGIKGWLRNGCRILLGWMLSLREHKNGSWNKIANTTFHRIIIDFEMQALQDLKEVNDQRFDSIDKRWGQVEDALRIEHKERQGDVHLLRERLQDRLSVSDNLEKTKAKVPPSACRL